MPIPPPCAAAGLFFASAALAQAQDLGAGGIPEEALHLWVGALLVAGIVVCVVLLGVIVASWRRPPKAPRVDPKFRAYARRALR